MKFCKLILLFIALAMLFLTNSSSANDAANTTNHVFLVAKATPEKPMVQSQIIYTVQLFYDQAIQNPRLTEPNVENAGVVNLQSERSYEKSVGGHIYKVSEVRYAIFPENPGPLTISGPIFTGNILQENPSNNSFYITQWKTLRVSANSVKLHVQPIPSNIKLGMWLPAQSLTLQQEWSESPSNFMVGKPITRTLTIEAQGLMAEQLPSLERWQPSGFKVYPDKPIFKNSTDGKTITGKRIEKYALIPQTAGELTLPAIKLYWWDTAMNKMNSFSIEEQTITVNPADTAITTVGSESNPSVAEFTTIQDQASEQRWKITAVSFLLLWLITLFLWWLTQKRIKKQLRQKELHSQTHTINQLRKKIKLACYANSLQECKDHLLDWANIVWPNEEIRNLGDIRKLIDDEDGKEVLCELDMHLYTVDTDSKWDGKQAWKTLDKLLKTKIKKSNNNDDGLPPLHIVGGNE